MNRAPVFDAFREILGRGLTDAEVAQIDAAFDEAEGVAKQTFGLTDPSKFFASVRGVFGPLAQSQVDGFILLLNAMGGAHWPVAWAAYGLATAWHETNETMEPVREAYWLSEDWRKTHLRYYPWYGRGFVQLTWKPNYENASEALGLGESLIADPDLAMEPGVAARILIWGMEGGKFVPGHALGTHLARDRLGSEAAFTEARRIINGTDKALMIAKKASAFQGALVAGGWG